MISQSMIGDFPAAWIQLVAEVVTTSSQQGQWLMVRKQGKYIPEYMKELPDNFTFECEQYDE